MGEKLESKTEKLNFKNGIHKWDKKNRIKKKE